MTARIKDHHFMRESRNYGTGLAKSLNDLGLDVSCERSSGGNEPSNAARRQVASKGFPIAGSPVSRFVNHPCVIVRHSTWLSELRTDYPNYDPAKKKWGSTQSVVYSPACKYENAPDYPAEFPKKSLIISRNAPLKTRDKGQKLCSTCNMHPVGIAMQYGFADQSQAIMVFRQPRQLP